ncbi:hypothetical protein GOV06_00960 [Candidatus Woesearchaeota archaeon]|nr:hypothetical protein [Candidatus Woesearchaeota archaeon]
MAIRFKQKCFRCKKNYVLASRRQRWIVCYDCQKAEMKGEIKDPKMKKMFDIPEEFYKENLFLRDIKIKYIKWGELTENQINAFKKVVKDLKNAQSSKTSK